MKKSPDSGIDGGEAGIRTLAPVNPVYSLSRGVLPNKKAQSLGKKSVLVAKL